MYKKIQDLKK